VADNIVRNISDTARWVAVYRAQENDREGGLFRDPFARRLAGERGEQIAESMRDGDRNLPDWSWTMRTYLFDQFIVAGIREGVDLVINLAAGLDARPYRMDLPESLTWIEVDLP
jgi:methyltransferase (TIGR00027 family)